MDFLDCFYYKIAAGNFGDFSVYVEYLVNISNKLQGSRHFCVEKNDAVSE